jgi:hypothetical protein
VQLNNGMAATVTSMDSENITLDLNHELAGKWLNFDVDLVKHCPAARMAKVAFGAGCFWGPELVGGRWLGGWMRAQVWGDPSRPPARVLRAWERQRAARGGCSRADPRLRCLPACRAGLPAHPG